MNSSLFFPRQRSRRGMTLIEILLVVSLIGLVSVAIYTALSKGIKVYERHQRLVTEEDIVLFMDKLSQDLRNAFLFSKFPFQGGAYKFSFPTIVLTPADRRSGAEEGAYIEQVGRVEYFYDVSADAIYRRQANYSQALDEKYAPPRELVAAIQDFKFRYFYFTDDEEIYSPEILDTIPSGVEVEVKFTDALGTRSLKKFIHVPIGI